MRLTIYESTCVVENYRYRMEYLEHGFSPLPEQDRRTVNTIEGWRHYRMPCRPIEVEVPFGCKVVRFDRPRGIDERLETHWEHRGLKAGDIYGLGAEAVLGLAGRRDRGFRMVENV